MSCYAAYLAGDKDMAKLGNDYTLLSSSQNKILPMTSPVLLQFRWFFFNGGYVDSHKENGFYVHSIVWKQSCNFEAESGISGKELQSLMIVIHNDLHIDVRPEK